MNGNGARRVVIAPMELADIPQVAEIDRLSFPLPWGATSYHYELTNNKTAHFIVAVDPAAPPRQGWFARLLGRPPARAVVGYAGFWFVVDEAHIGTIATHPDWRGRGVGERLLVALLHDAIQVGAVEAKLEVRMSNQRARALYRKYGFEEAGRRKGYYRDNREDAILMNVRLDGARRERILDAHQTLRSQETA
jgi:ribosomal-protein-alanine N-acetyltransferase